MDVIDGGAGTNTFNVSSGTGITVPTGALVTNIQTAHFVSTSTVVTDVTGFTGLTTLTVVGNGTETLTAAATTDVTATDVAQAVGLISIAGGKNVALTTTATDSGGTVLLGNIAVGTATAPVAGTVNITATDTDSASGSAPSNITVIGGTAVTINSKVNAGVTLAANAGSQTANDAGLISVGTTAAPATGAVSVTNETHITATSAISSGVVGDKIAIIGGTTVTVNETASVVQTATGAATSVTMGAVGVTGTAATTAVTVTQAAAATGAAPVLTATAASAGVPTLNGSNVVAVVAAPGVTAVAAVTAANKVAAIPVSAGTLTVVNGAVTIADAYAGSTTVANTIAAVTLTNYGNSTITSTALSTLSLSGTGDTGTGGTLDLTLGGSAATIAAHKTLTLNLGGGSLGVISDLTSTKQIATVNAVMSADTTVAGITDSALRTLALSGTGVLTLTAVNTALTSITETGAAGFNDGGNLYAATSVTSFSGAGSTGDNTVTLNANQAFAGGSGVDTVTIGADPKFAITGGGGANVLVLTAGGGYTLAGAGTLVSGFPTMSSASTSGTFNMALLPADITALISTGNANTLAYTNVVTNTTLTLIGTHTATSYTLGTTNGAGKAVTVALGDSSTANGTFGTVSLLDSNSNGIGTVNLASNGKNVSTGSSTANYNTVVLTDAGITALNVSGTDGLTMTSHTDTNITALTIGNTNTSTHGLLITDLIDATLDTLTFTGTGATVVTALHDGAVTNLTIANSGTGTVLITDINSGSSGDSGPVLTHLTLNGNVALGGGGSVAALLGGTDAPVDFASTGAVTISGATDNAGVGISFTAANTNAASITLGNGNNDVRLGVDSTYSLTGGGTVTTGSGMDFIWGKFIAAGATTGWTIDAGAGDDAIYGGLGTSTTVHNTYIGGDGADFIQLMTGAVTHSTSAAAAGQYAAVAFAGSATTGTTLTNGSWTGTLYAESQDTITSTGINSIFATQNVGNTVNTAGAGKIFAGANIISDLYGQGAYEVASTAKDVFFFQTAPVDATGGAGTGGAKLGVVNVENFKIGQDIIAVTNYQNSGDNLFVGTAAAVTAINAVNANEAFLASTHGWTWALDTGSTTSGTLAYTAGNGTQDLSTSGSLGAVASANMSIHLVGVQGTIVTVDSFFYQG